MVSAHRAFTGAPRRHCFVGSRKKAHVPQACLKVFGALVSKASDPMLRLGAASPACLPWGTGGQWKAWARGREEKGCLPLLPPSHCGHCCSPGDFFLLRTQPSYFWSPSSQLQAKEAKPPWAASKRRMRVCGKPSPKGSAQEGGGGWGDGGSVCLAPRELVIKSCPFQQELLVGQLSVFR